jgi:hypothetical protein
LYFNNIKWPKQKILYFMKKSALILIALLTVCFAASARQISENEAMLKAAAFGQKAVASRLMSTSRSSAMNACLHPAISHFCG